MAGTIKLWCKKAIDFFWNSWEKHNFITSLIFTIIPVVFYHFGYLSNIRENTGSIITYVTALVTINGVFLTLLITLKESPVFIRLKNSFPHLHDYLYKGLRKQILACIVFMIINIVIAVVGPDINITIAYSGILIWSYFMVNVSVGALYTLKIVTDLAVSEVEKRKPMR